MNTITLATLSKDGAVYARVNVGRLTLFFSEGAAIAYGVKRRVGDEEWEEAKVWGGALSLSTHRLAVEEELGKGFDDRVGRTIFESSLTALLGQFDLLGEE